MRLWVLAHELAGHVLLSPPHLREALSRPRAPARRRVPSRPERGGRPPRGARRRGGDPMAALQQALGDPEVLLGAVTSPEQQALRPASTPSSPSSSATPTGSSTPSPCASSAATPCASPRRCAGGGSRRRERHVRRAAARHPPRRRSGRPRQGVRPRRRRPRRGRRARAAAAAGPDAIPTPNEVDAPGLWLARLGDAADRREGAAATPVAARRRAVGVLGGPRRAQRRGAVRIDAEASARRRGLTESGGAPIPTTRKPMAPGMTIDRDQPGQRPAELEPGLELGERPAAVGLRGVALDDRLEAPTGRWRPRS